MAKPALLATKLTREHAAEMLTMEGEELKKLRGIYSSARIELLGRLAHLPRDKFTAQQTRIVLAQVTSALRAMNKKLGESWSKTLDRRLQRSVTQTLREVAQYEPQFKQAQGAIQTAVMRSLARPQGLLLDQYETSVSTYGTGMIRAVGDRLALHAVMKSSWSAMARDIASTMKGELWRAERIVRTELINALDTAQSVTFAELAKTFPDLKSQWDATNDARICRICEGLEGQLAGPGQLFAGKYKGPPAHPNCRCRRIPYRAAWLERHAELEPAPKPAKTQPEPQPKPTPTLAPTPPAPAPAPAPTPEESVATAARARVISAAQAIVRGRAAAESRIKAVEDTIRFNDFETAVAFDEAGTEVFRKPGAKTYVSFTLEELAPLRGRRFTHNHPSGRSFSAEDIQLSATYGIGEMRAAGRYYTYIMRPPKKRMWDADFWQDKIRPAMQSAHNEVYGETMRKIDSGEMTRAQASLEHQHEVWKRASRRVGLRYSRRKA